MSTIVNAIQNALAHHQAGRLDQAASLYRQVLAANPRHAGAMHLLGLAALQSGQAESAIDWIRRAIEIDDGRAAFHANLAEAYCSLGRYDSAQASCVQALRLNPQFAEARYKLGMVLEQQGDRAEAVVNYEQAVAIKPEYVAAQRRLGLALQLLGRPDEATAALRRAIELDARDLEARFVLAGILQAQRRFQEAEAEYRAALAVDPHFAEAHNGLGVVAQTQYQPQQAIAHYVEALRIRPNYFEAHYNWGTALAAQGMQAEAVARYRDAIACRPDSADVHCRLGTALQRLGRLDEAAAAYGQAIRLRPDYVAALCNLGTVLHEQGRSDEAIELFERALRANPAAADTYNNLGNALHQTGHSDRALDCYRKSLQLAPDFPDAHHNLAILYLGKEQFAEGWNEYAWRLKCQHIPSRPFTQPLWQGEPLAGRTLLLHAEQGLGDTLQMLRYAPQARERGGRVLLEVQPQLVPLVRVSGFSDVLPGGGELPPFDVHAPLLSLPGIFGAHARTMAQGVPYLSADPQLVARWREKLPEIEGFRVGIVWQGNPQNQRDRTRSIPLSSFAPLAAVAGVRLVSLQKGRGSEQVAHAGFPLIDLGRELDEVGGAFMDTAAVIQCLDLVITSDTALAHLAGALGVTGWVALSRFADWRWFEHRADSPWYPSLRLFRQQQPGDWPGVMDRMAEGLSALVRRSGP